MPRSYRILIAENDPEVLTFLSGTLSRSRYWIVTASDMCHALSTYVERSLEIDLIVANETFAEAFYKLDPKPPILMIADYGRDLYQIHNIPKSSQLLKIPFTAAELLDAVRASLVAGDLGE